MRSSPHHVESERALLGVMLEDIASAVEAGVLGLVQARDFYRPEHGELFGLLAEMVHEGVAVDIVTVSERLQKLGPSRFGGASYVAELPEHAPSTANGGHYARIVAETAARRRTFHHAERLAAAAAAGVVPLAEALAVFTAALDDMRPPEAQEGDALLGEQIRRTEADAEAGPVREFSTSLPTLDRIIGGISARELTVIAGRTSWGKSALGVGILVEHALRGGPCGVVSLEMDRAMVVHRIVAQLSGVPLPLVKVGGADAQDAEAIRDAKAQLQDAPLHVDNRGGQTMAQIRQTVRRWKQTTGLDMVLIDYLGLVRRPHGPTHEGVGAIVKECKRLAQELDVGVILCVQLNRKMFQDKMPKVAKGADWWMHVPTPQLDQLAESGDVERDADKVLFPVPADVIRDGGILRTLDAPPGAAVVMVAKNRQGRTGVAKVRWFGATATFEPWTEEPSLRVVAGGRHYSETEREDEP